MTRLVQIKKGSMRRVALVEEPNIRLLDATSSIYEVANSAIRAVARWNTTPSIKASLHGN